MSNTELIQKRRYAGISILMLVMGLLFLYYLGSTLYHTEKKMQSQSISSAINCIEEDFK